MGFQAATQILLILESALHQVEKPESEQPQSNNSLHFI